MVANVQSDNEEHSKSAKVEVIGSQEIHNEEEEDQEEEDAIPNFEIDDDNGYTDGLGNEYEYKNDNDRMEDEGFTETVDTYNLTTGYASIIMLDYLLT